MSDLVSRELIPMPNRAISMSNYLPFTTSGNIRKFAVLVFSEISSAAEQILAKFHVWARDKIVVAVKQIRINWLFFFIY